MKALPKLYRLFRLSVLLTLVALVLEFVLGMYTALFIEFPDSVANGNAWAWSMAQSPVILVHVLLGTVLVGASLLAFGLGLTLKSKAAISTTLAGLILTGLAYLSGGVFLSDIQADGYSFSMALGFMGAVVAYGMAYYLTRGSGQTAS
jgi:hypothetical protein